MRIVFTAWILLIGINCQASHVLGTYISVSHHSCSKYLIKYTLSRDCGGINAPDSIAIYYGISGVTPSIKFIHLDTSYIHIPLLCITVPANCPAGLGKEINIYKDTIDITTSGLYKFSANLCCMNAATNLPPMWLSPNYVESLIYIHPPFPTSLPDFTSNPEFRFCLNNYINYPNNAYDADGDSLIYSLVPAMMWDTSILSGVPLNYPSGHNQYTFGMLLNQATIDSTSGMVSFFAGNFGAGIMAIKIDEYRNGIWNGSVIKDNYMFISSGTAGFNENSNKISAFPNPASDFIYINGIKNSRCSISSVAGNIINSDLAIQEGRADIRHLLPGIYILFFYNENNVANIKLVKR